MDLVFVERGPGRVVVRGAGENVRVGTVVVVGEIALGSILRARLYVRDVAVLARLVRLPFARTPGRARRELGQHEVYAGIRQPDEPLVQVIRERQGHRRPATTVRYIDCRDRDVDSLGGLNRHAAARRRSRLSRLPRWSRGTGCARGAVVAFTASKEDAEENERCNSARAVQEACHFWSP